MDLNGKVYSMVTKLREKPEDESLLDECLILPSLVSISSNGFRIYVDIKTGENLSSI